MVQLSRDLGESRGRCVALEKQAHEVAQIEAAEIANMQVTLHRMKRELAERNVTNQMTAELTAKTSLLSEADQCVAVECCSVGEV